MPSIRYRPKNSWAVLLLGAATIVPASQAWAAPRVRSAPVAASPCGAGGGTPLALGTAAEVPIGSVQRYTVEIGAGQGVIVDLSPLRPQAPPSDDDHAEDTPKPRSLVLCDARGRLLVPMPGEVFEKGGSVTFTPDGERLRFLSPTTAQYTIGVTAGAEARELLVRRRTGGAGQAPVVAATIGREAKGIASSAAPMVFSFTASAGAWVEIKSTSEKDTMLRLAGPDRLGDYSVIAENDDSDGLNPKIRRKLPVAGTYYAQVDSLSDEPGELTFSVMRSTAPPPPPPPMALRAGARIGGKLADSDSAVLYALPVVAGHSYRLELTAAYDGVVAIGLPNPLEPENGGDGPDAGFAEIKSQDGGTSGTEKLTFTARSTGRLLVRVKSFGIGETDGTYSLSAADLGG